MSLTNKRIVFVEKYLTCWNATQAAKDAGYSQRTAYSIGQRLLKNVEIQDLISLRLNELKMDADEVLIRLGKMARGEIPTKTVKKDKGPEVYYDELAALEKVGKTLALFMDRIVIEEMMGLEVIDDDEEISNPSTVASS